MKFHLEKFVIQQRSVLNSAHRYLFPDKLLHKNRYMVWIKKNPALVFNNPLHKIIFDIGPLWAY